MLTALEVSAQRWRTAVSASRIWVFDEGRLVEDGPAAQVCDNPRSDRARAFFKAAS